MNSRVKQWIGFLIMVIGLGLLAGPFILGASEGKKQKKIVDNFYSDIKTTVEVGTSVDAEGGSGSEADEVSPEVLERANKLWNAASSYNASLKGRQDNMNSTTDVESFELDLTEFGYAENIIGTIKVPRLEQELAIYLGASMDNLSTGTAIFGMTSIPLGKMDENAVIAGHRGWYGTPIFRQIQKMQLNDPIYITTPFGTLTYRVCSIVIVDNDDVSWCKIREGRSLISLMSCHPYGSYDQNRYVVTAELTDEKMPSEEEIIKNNIESYDPGAREVTRVSLDGTKEIIYVDPVSIQADGREYDSYISNVLIFAEDKMRFVAYVVAGIVTTVGIWLIMVTIIDIRGKKKKGDKHESE